MLIWDIIIKTMQEHSQLQPDTSNTAFDIGQLGLSIFRSLPIGIVVFDENLKILEANPCALNIIPLSEYIDKSLADGTDEKIWNNWTELLKSVLNSGETSIFNDISYTSNGKTKLLRIICTPLKTSESAAQPGGTILIEDITDRINIQNQLANVEKLASVGKLASKVAHELNNPLDGILRYINLTIRIIEQENLKKPQEYLTHCRRGLMRMIQIVSELLEFSRSTYAPAEKAAIEQIIEDAIKTLSSKIEASKIKIIRNYKSGIPKIRTGNLYQVFCNIAKNAIDAMPNGGELRITTSMTSDTIVINFQDTGTGLPPQSIESIFEPFFTTKDKGKGTGLGLAICKDIIESYSGRITAENAPEGGSIFSVYLPLKNK